MSEALALSLVGLDAHLVRVRAGVEAGAGSFEIAGFPESHTRELRVRVRGALRQIGIEMLERAVTIAFSPSDLPLGGAFDLAVVIAILVALGVMPASAVLGTLVVGELSLNGALRAARGVLPGLRGAAARLGIARAVVPQANAREAAHVPEIAVLVAEDLRHVIACLRGEGRVARMGVAMTSRASPRLLPGLSGVDVPRSPKARRALEIAASGGHHLLLVGPPETRKAMVARGLSAILPPLTLEESIEVTSIYSVAGLLSPEVGVVGARPFRGPHYTVSAAGLVGGGDPARPGEVSLAHHGVLFLDEVLEFRSGVLDSLHRPLEEGHVVIGRAGRRATFPAKPLVVAATNPCPCGLAADRSRRCTCSAERLRAHEARLDSRWFDRFDMRVDVSEVRGRLSDEPSQDMRDRVVAVRARRTERARHGAPGQTNSQLSPGDLERFAKPDAAGARVLARATEKLNRSAVVHGRVLRVARTIADLDGSEAVRALHVAEALQMVITRVPMSTASCRSKESS